MTMCTFSRNILYCLLCSISLTFNQDAGAQQTPLGKLLQTNQYELFVQDGELSGSGAPFIKKALSEAQFVAIGEEHGTREVPQFVWATCRAMARENLDAMAVEAGPLVTAKLEQWAAESGGTASLTSFEKVYPDSIAFFNWKQEFDLLSHCQQATAPRTLHLWGLDQEFLGSPTFILQQIVESRLGPQTEAIVTKLQAQCAADAQKSFASGSWKDACMFHLPAADLSRLQFALAHTGNLRAQDLTAALVKTQHIYSSHESGYRYEANRERALLLKHNFILDYQQLSKTNGRPPRVLLKFGGNHLYKGFDETDLNDLGNFVTEFADGLGSTSLHIEVLGIRGENEVGLGPGKPDRAVAKDANPAFMAPFYAQAYSGAWTVFDLRPLRSQFDDLGHVDRELERLIFGYDMLVLVPEVTPEVVIK
jgi:hypothetical protein